MAHIEPAQTVISCAEVELSRTQPQRRRACDVRVLDEVGPLLYERIRVLRESAGRGEQQALVLRRGFEQALDELETEGRGLRDELRVVIGGVRRAGVRQRVAKLVDGEPFRRAGNAQQR